ncbi:MAG: hypothetical protein OEZ54_04705 [Gemmatimonadota bacterium]|nr:hypothetical protein [Gemmatimonadota bacterium]
MSRVYASFSVDEIRLITEGEDTAKLCPRCSGELAEDNSGLCSGKVQAAWSIVRCTGCRLMATCTR